MAARRRYAALGDFLDGYLHQDFKAEDRDAPGAARAFARVATDARRRSVTTDLRRWLAHAHGKQADAWRRDLASIGGAWRPESLAAVRELVSIIDPAGGVSRET